MIPSEPGHKGGRTVAVIGFPGSGRQLVQKLVADILALDERESLPNKTDSQGEDVRTIDLDHAALRQLDSHSAVTVMVVRDLRDVLVSLFARAATGQMAQVDPTCCFDDIESFYYDYFIAYTHRFSGSNSLLDYYEDYMAQNVPLIRYEKLVDNPANELSRLMLRLGLNVPETDVARAVRNIASRHLQRRGDHAGGTRWDELPAKVLADMEDRFGSLLKRFGYACGTATSQHAIPYASKSFTSNSLDLEHIRSVDPMQPKRRFTLQEIQPGQLAPGTPPEPSGWVRGWHGLYFLEEALPAVQQEQFQRKFMESPYDAFILEYYAFLSILECYSGRHVNFFELGSGRAPWCLTLAGAIRFPVHQEPPASCRVLAVEGEPVHYRWTRDHLEKQNIPSVSIHGVISSRPGTLRFQADMDPQQSMGQSVSERGNIEVEAFTVDQLREMHGFDRIHMIHMDVQGMEVEAIKGTQKTIEQGKLDHLIIGTHSPELEQQLHDMLTDRFRLLIDLPIKQTKHFEGISRPVCSHDDGVHVWQRIGFE